MKRVFGVNDLSEFEERMFELKNTLEPPTDAGRFIAHTDGACLGNPEGPGGWAAVIDAADGRRWQLFGHLSSTSNNRAEALGVLGALEWIPSNSRLELHSDSELTVRILEGRYKARSNLEIWDFLRRTMTDKQIAVTATWLRGHAGDPLNELADQLSKLGAVNADLAQLPVPAAPVATVGVAAAPELVGVQAKSDWERAFLRSIADQLRRGGKLSDKQQAVLDRMRAAS